MKNLSLAENDTGGQAVTLRLFLVRHGETEANAQDFVVGQEDSVRFFLFVSESFPHLYVSSTWAFYCKRPLMYAFNSH